MQHSLVVHIEVFDGWIEGGREKEMCRASAGAVRSCRAKVGIFGESEPSPHGPQPEEVNFSTLSFCLLLPAH